MVRPWSPIWVVAAIGDLVDPLGGQLRVAAQQLADALDDEVVGAGLGVHALVAGLAERGADAVDEDDVAEGAGHVGPPAVRALADWLGICAGGSGWGPGRRIRAAHLSWGSALGSRCPAVTCRRVIRTASVAVTLLSPVT